MTDSHEPSDAVEPWLEPDEETALALALRAAYDPAPLAKSRHARLLAAALEDPFAPPTEEEVRASERLRPSTPETGDDRHPAAALARALAAAHHPETLPSERAGRAARPAVGKRANVVFVAFGAAALAAAAAFALLLGHAGLERPATPPLLARSRSTAELFHERFEPGQASARIDRIATSRERDWRDNQYSLWGVR